MGLWNKDQLNGFAAAVLSMFALYLITKLLFG